MDLLIFDILMIVYIGVNVLVALGCIACGSWYFASLDVRAYIRVFVRSANDHSLEASGVLILLCGIFLFIGCVFAILGIIMRRRRFLSVFLFTEVLVLVLGLIAGFIAVGLYWDIHMNVKAGMQDQLNQYYDENSHVGWAWNRVQVKKHCCGADGSWDYLNTKWFARNNPLDATVKKYVPKSCCTLNFNQDRELYWVDAQNILPRDEARCQQDAAGRIGNSANLNQKGCYAALFQIDSKLFRDVTIFSVINSIEGLGLGGGFLQLIGIALTVLYVRGMSSPREKR